MADVIRGSVIYQAEDALKRLADDEELLYRARQRFSKSPPPIASPSGHSTRSQSPDQPSQHQLSVRERRFQLSRQHWASTPLAQFSAQCSEYTHFAPAHTSSTLAAHTIRQRWIAQNIWRDEWDTTIPGILPQPGGRWKHEDPLDAGTVLGAAQEQEREASRPWRQFFHQVSAELSHILAATPASDTTPRNVTTQAYEAVKTKWALRGIWDNGWGHLPGMTWKHEHPLEELLVSDPILTAADWAEQRAERERQERHEKTDRGNKFRTGSGRGGGAPASSPRRSQRLNGRNATVQPIAAKPRRVSKRPPARRRGQVLRKE